MDKIIDTHAHIYPQKIAQKAVDSIGSFYDIPMAGGNGTSEGLLASGGKIGVERYVVHSTATKPSQVESINDFIHGECEKHPEFSASGYGRRGNRKRGGKSAVFRLARYQTSPRFPKVFH